MSSDFPSTDIGRSMMAQLASVEDDLSDVSVYYQYKNPGTATEYTLLDVTNGPKTLLTGRAVGHYFQSQSDVNWNIGPITVDGSVTSVFPNIDFYARSEDQGGNLIGALFLPPLRYDSSLKVEWQHGGSGYYVTVAAFILGSGPHNVAVVKDGEPVYMSAQNLSEATIEQMNVPKGYKIVKNPEIDHPEPQTRGMWDDDKEEVVDHPYWEPFHDTLEKLDGMRRRAGSQKVIEKIERNPTSFENMLEGENPMEDPVEEAVQFWYEREKEQSTDLSELDRIRGG